MISILVVLTVLFVTFVSFVATLCVSSQNNSLNALLQHRDIEVD